MAGNVAGLLCLAVGRGATNGNRARQTFRELPFTQCYACHAADIVLCRLASFGTVWMLELVGSKPGLLAA